MSMTERAREALRNLGSDPNVVARHLEIEDWPEEARDDLEVAGLLSVLYRETGRLLAQVTEKTTHCDYIAMPDTIELADEDPHVAARWEAAWVEARLAELAFDEQADQWLSGYAAAEQAVTAATKLLDLVKAGPVPAHTDPRSPRWDDVTDALQRAQRLVEEARAGKTHTTTPVEES
ncbi:hypothetical protein [Gandjariella thermophila]|nr:hypothetical protein [Gandjariella thermophila]